MDASNGCDAGRAFEAQLPIPGSPSSSKTTLIETVRKKALLIGIRGTKTATVDYPELKGSHNDVASVRDLLVDCYGYKSSDITVLIDDDVPGHTQPTRINILEAIAALVKDAKEGDHFCFHYSGHSTQIKNRSGSEDDGMDECLIPSDGEEHLIVDNELNATLLVPLPAGSHLVAVLDTCHSGTLLDLRHKIWMDGKLVKPKATRKNALLSTARALTFLANLKTRPIARRSSTRMLARRDEIINMNVVCAPPTASAAEPNGEGARQNTFTYRSRTVDYASCTKQHPVGNAPPTLPGKFTAAEECTSPVEMTPVEVFASTGWSHNQDKSLPAGRRDAKASGGGVKADVISLASCNDSQSTWEDNDGKTMTWSLVQILRANPNQSVNEVLVTISRAMYTKALVRHNEAQEYKTKYTDVKRKAEQSIKRILRTVSAMGPDMDAGPPPRALANAPTFPPPPPRRRSVLMQRVSELKQLVIDMPPPSGYDMSTVESPELWSARPINTGRRFFRF
ncbi:caspase domain-containing protein [Mycena rosella]|uniref:Caspase domain-containing protein n=1 Tax=Mycena rosella TaxID=1033263 RepID=A0AAD7G6J0_MYCRO|nr:caspase domain-containing protein [Mycena rosella]